MGGGIQESPEVWTPKRQAELESDEVRESMIAHEMSKVSVNMDPVIAAALFDGLAALVESEVAA